MAATTGSAIAWDKVKLVAFDVDGTLYSQGRLRAAMALELAIHSAARRELTTVRVLRAYRRLREEMGASETADFEVRLREQTAQMTRVRPQDVGGIVRRWMEERPLRFLRPLRFKGVSTLFDTLRRSGRTVGVVSDYPAAAKLDALGLSADHVVSAGDAEVGVLKPNPRGLQLLMQQAGARPCETLMIGDRACRDGEAARRAGAQALIKSRAPLADWPNFARYDDEIFTPVLAS